MEFLHKFTAAPLDFLRDYALPFAVVMSILVFVHEWGHYIVARMCGVRVKVFSIGFGPEVFGRTDKNGTRWKFSWIPLGGYVQMFGDVDPTSSGHADGVKEGGEVRPFTDEEKKVAFYSQSVGRRSAIVFAGPAINYLFAILIMTVLFSTEGQPYTPAIAAAVMADLAADKAGIKPDDKIIEANGTEIMKFQDLVTIVSLGLDKPLELKILHAAGKGKWNETPVTINLTPKLVEETDRFGFKHTLGRIGISAPKGAFEMKPHTFGSAAVAAVAETWHISANTLTAIGQMILGTRSKDELGGLLRIGAYAGEFAKQGVAAFVGFMALLSVSLGLFNLLPVPLLDGGHLAFYALEKLKGTPVNERAQEYAFRTGFALLIGLMLLANWNDLIQMKVIDYVMNLIS